MSLELLISKYIDGELSSNEDANLRQMLKDNSFAKEKFDQSVELHMDLVADSANINVPKELLKKTEDAVLMKIFAAPAYVEVPKLASNNNIIRKLTYRISSVAAVIAIFTLISLIQIGDENYPRIIEFFESEKGITAITEITATTSNSKVANSINPAINNANEQNDDLASEEYNTELGVIIENNLIESNISAPTVAQTSSDLIFDNIPSVTADLVKNSNNKIVLDKITEHTIQASSELFINDINSNLVNSNMPNVNFGFSGGPEITAIQFNTVLGRDFARTGISTSDNNPMISMSQSIGYSLNSGSTVGIEFGITELNYDYIKFIPVSGQENLGSSFGVNTPGGSGGGIGTSLNIPVKLQRQTQFFWAMAFYDTRIINYGAFSIIGRIGLGATDDGPLGLGRLTARYSLLDNLAITAGAEGRMFMLKTPLLESSVANISSYGFNYGIQLNF